MNSTSADLTGRTALVSGGASGIGAACVRRLAQASAHVTVLDVNADQAEQLTSGIGGASLVAPSFVETAMTRAIIEKTGGSWEDLVKAATERAAVRRIGQPEDIAAVIAFLASPDSGFVTGQTIYATGSPAV